jgi:hypothetical protein
MSGSANGNGNGSNGNAQGWARLVVQIIAYIVLGLVAVLNIKSDLRDLDTRLSGKIVGLTQHLDDLKDAADAQHRGFEQRDVDLNRQIEELRNRMRARDR